MTQSVFHISSLEMKEEPNKKFWNSGCDELNSSVWLPCVSEEGPNYSISKKHITEIQTPTSLSSTISVELDKGALHGFSPKEAETLASKKIRIYPKDTKKYEEALSIYRRSYNLAVERYKGDSYKDDNGKWRNLRPEIKQIVKEECESDGRVYNSIIVDNAVLSARQAFKAACSRNKKHKGGKGGFSEIKFKSRKSTRQSFSMDRLPKGLNPAIRALGKIHITEEVPDEAINKSFTVTRERGRWYICVQKHIPLGADIQGQVKCVSIDPGVRTFATCYSESEVLIFGDDFAKDKLAPLMKRVDRLIGLRQKVLNNAPKEPTQWVTDRVTHFNREIDRLRTKKDDLILDMHNRVAHHLVSHYDVIFLPTFETSKMAAKKSKRRRIRANTCRQMLDLSHYQFKMRLKWYAKKYGKHVVDCNEAYTSKTRSWDGTIDDKLGSSKVIKGDGFIVNRDVNGARNIFMKCLTR